MWAPRARSGNSKSFWETAEAMRAVFEADWELARQGHSLEKMIIRADDDDVWRDTDGDGINDEVEEVREALWHHAFEIYGAFDYYAAQHSDQENAKGEPDVFNWTFNAFLDFIRDVKLPTKCLKARDFELIWVQVNAEERRTKDLDVFNKTRHLNRQEFLQVLVHVACMRFFRRSSAGRQNAEEVAEGGVATDVSEAVEHMCLNHLRGLLPPMALQDSNDFRAKNCYCAKTDAVLKKHLPTLRNLYEFYANAAEFDARDALASQNLMSIGEWICFVEDIGFVESQQVTLFEVKMIFMWSRIRGCRDYSKQSFVRMRHLFFEDFLEAIVRLASLCALPTDEDVASAGSQDAGDYLNTLQVTHSAAYAVFLKDRRGRWDREPRQRIWRCVDHLMSLITQTIESNVHITRGGVVEAADNQISAAEARQFMQKRRGGTNLTRRVSVSMSKHQLDFLEFMKQVREKLEESLIKVPIFSHMSKPQIGLLRDAMTEAPFEPHEFVFAQGDVGDCFYVILSGEARVLREDPETGEERVLADLGEGAYFGERSLLKGEKRYASIQACSKLQTMCIDKSSFEGVLGPLADLVPDLH